MRVAMLAASLLFCGSAHEAAAQSQPVRRGEAGITVGSACLVSSSACGGGREAMPGIYGSFWLTPRVEIGARIAGLTRPEILSTLTYSGPNNEPLQTLEYLTYNRERKYFLGYVNRHFGAEPRIRAFAGIAVGTQADRFFVSCHRRECPIDLPSIGGPPTGRHQNYRGNLALSAGLSGAATRVAWRAGLNLHSFARENVGATELFVAGGVRF